MTSQPFKIPEGLTRATEESLERIRLMARQRILEYREKKKSAAAVRPAPITNPRGCPTD